MKEMFNNIVYLKVIFLKNIFQHITSSRYDSVVKIKKFKNNKVCVIIRNIESMNLINFTKIAVK